MSVGSVPYRHSRPSESPAHIHAGSGSHRVNDGPSNENRPFSGRFFGRPRIKAAPPGAIFDVSAINPLDPADLPDIAPADGACRHHVPTNGSHHAAAVSIYDSCYGPRLAIDDPGPVNRLAVDDTSPINRSGLVHDPGDGSRVVAVGWVAVSVGR